MEFWHKMKKENTETVKKMIEENPKVTDDEIQEKFGGTFSENELINLREVVVKCQK